MALLTIALIVVGIAIVLFFIKGLVKLAFWVFLFGLLAIGIHFILKYFGVL